MYFVFIPCREMDPSRAPLSEAEFEEIMNRNRAISSSAISRAVSDASAGNAQRLCYINTLKYRASVKTGRHFYNLTLFGVLFS